MPRVSLEEVVRLSAEVLEGLGVSERDAQTVADTIRYANGRNVPTHGIARLLLYEKKIKAGSIDPVAKPEIVVDNGAVGVVDGHDALGQVVARVAMELALNKVHEYGVAAVAVRNSNNFGTAGYYGTWAASEGCGAIIMANSSPAMAPTGGAKPLFGTNPICMALPGTQDGFPIVLDMATTVAARGKIRNAANEGVAIPSNWALDSCGVPTTDAKAALSGSLQPVGGYKGYGISLFVDLFAGMLAQGAFAGRVAQLGDSSQPSRNGHFFLLFDVSRFVQAEEYEVLLAQLVAEVKSCGGDVRLPGERGSNYYLQNDGIVVIAEKHFKEANRLADLLGVKTLCALPE